MPGNKFSSFLYATTQIVKVSISFIVTLYYAFSTVLGHSWHILKKKKANKQRSHESTKVIFHENCHRKDHTFLWA
jgi:hypothetical protein